MRFLMLSLLMLASFHIAQALPPIAIYSFTPATPAFALSSINPSNHQSFITPPSIVMVKFSGTIDPTGSELTVFDQYNTIVAKASYLQEASYIELNLPQHLLAGSYRLEWKALCACAAKTALNGTSYFSIY